MANLILIPTALRQFTDGLGEVEVEAKTVGEALDKLTGNYADLKRHLYNEQNKLRSFVNVYVNEEDIRQKNGLETQLGKGDTIMLVPSIAGGAPETDADESALPDLTKDEVTRYSRHLILPEVGVEGQKKLKKSKVLLIGTGGLGAPLAMYLAAAGVGTIGIVDFDLVDETNLQRQIIHGTRDIGRPKIASARDRIKGINPNVNVVSFETRLSSENALDIIKDFDVVADGTDNFPTRYLVNDACVFLKKPNVYGSVFRFEGQASVFYAEKGACYRCLYHEPPPPGLVPSCAEGGILGVLPGIIGCIQANETIKLLIGGGDPLINRLLIFDSWKMRFKELKLAKDPDCPVCGKNPTVTSLIDYEDFCGLKRSETCEMPIEEITALELKARFDKNDKIQIIDIREPHELSIGKLPNTKAIPFGQVVRRQSELDPSVDTVFVCKVGNRSAIAIRALKDSGYTGRLINLKYGINGWANDVDNSMALY
ncbi:MAG: molybdopterin-synthase adenylyltransferase MoeB [Brevinematales bacterium]